MRPALRQEVPQEAWRGVCRRGGHVRAGVICEARAAWRIADLYLQLDTPLCRSMLYFSPLLCLRTVSIKINVPACWSVSSSSGVFLAYVDYHPETCCRHLLPIRTVSADSADMATHTI